LYIFYYDLDSGDLSFLVSNLGNDRIKYTRRSSITITKGRNRGPVRGNIENRTIHPLAAAADPASGTVWVYYTDVQGIVNNAFTKDGGSTWASGDVIDAQIQMLGSFTISVYFDPSFSEPCIVSSEVHKECLCESFNEDGSWRNEYVEVWNMCLGTIRSELEWHIHLRLLIYISYTDALITYLWKIIVATHAKLAICNISRSHSPTSFSIAAHIQDAGDQHHRQNQEKGLRLVRLFVCAQEMLL